MMASQSNPVISMLRKASLRLGSTCAVSDQWTIFSALGVSQTR